ncbi:hypothetical protein NHX12_005740 [Muraenolepis orangiensis]|uniref:Uncharacterized protein n=1 Tax=Muraenolepis orangiensis TaxID=630683 RepID=A0A9Q0DUH2_9TELE|nr:hypothetical protein NHX12_005740 [Muraenolepis orangiensis]
MKGNPVIPRGDPIGGSTTGSRYGCGAAGVEPSVRPNQDDDETGEDDALPPQGGPASTGRTSLYREDQPPQGGTASTGRPSLYRETRPPQGETASTGGPSLYRGAQPLQGGLASTGGPSLYREAQPLQGGPEEEGQVTRL